MACSRLEKKEITIEMAEQELRDIISPDEKREVTPELIINTAVSYTHLDVYKRQAFHLLSPFSSVSCQAS